MPKPERRKKGNARAAPGRASGTRAPGSDPASFDKTALEAIHGTHPASWLRPSVLADDAHHTLGRGQEFGAGKKDLLREIFSSPFNMTPIDRLSHDQAALRNVNIRRLFLDMAFDAVMRAVVERRYSLQDHDRQFLTFSRAWRLNPRTPQLLRLLEA